MQIFSWCICIRHSLMPFIYSHWWFSLLNICRWRKYIWKCVFRWVPLASKVQPQGYFSMCKCWSTTFKWKSILYNLGSLWVAWPQAYHFWKGNNDIMYCFTYLWPYFYVGTYSPLYRWLGIQYIISQGLGEVETDKVIGHWILHQR